ncbi:NAD(P)H-dependent glycerol-3-phosphate dehydrogenase [filamentous cyanobacterium LEGE 11480]|uniref:Glycerol-3-phosphate dehydrogenase [NAD(P)+] n=1 Tax=Romeriopsis navalis LEGE 11480 TaxID=2777977 RepID=A0A928VL93_9CYAN|nr:NAD(P)H-dependent glycerol-3-phosphate dehydrogenase [Romeriopsis navalis]MBE9030673.1 NAD(P)H-dependent glycerol-3-phosphate dehydrogenase [Romeriopsis navalis LEGE 11480]
MHITVIGAGAWGSTLAALAAENDHQITLWSRRLGTPLLEAVSQADVILCAISMQGVREISAQLAGLASDVIILSATKGLDLATATVDTLPLLPSQLWQAAFPDNPIVVLSGPNLATEIQQGLPAATVAASDNLAAAKTMQSIFSSHRFRVYANPDRIGVELCGALKNVIAIAVGTCDGLNLGTNAKSALITRGLAEMTKLGSLWQIEFSTFYGLAGLGDLMATCSSAFSRNYQVGYALGQGQTIEQILHNLQGTAEGINTTAVLLQLANQQQIELPIAQQVGQLLNHTTTPQLAMQTLMERQVGIEHSPD